MQSSGERQPLLVPPDDSSRTHRYARRKSQRRRSVWTVIGITVASLLLALLLLAAVLFNSFIPTDRDIDVLTEHAVSLHPSPKIQVLNFTRSYTTGFVQISGEAGIDALQVLGIGEDAEQDRGQGAAWWEHLRRIVGRKAIHFAGPLVAELPQAITIYAHGSSKPLLNVTIAGLIDIPLVLRDTINASHDASWLRPFTQEIQIDLLSRTDLVGFATKAWAHGETVVNVVVPRIQARSRHSRGWRRWLRVERENVQITRRIQVPDLPGLPKPTDDLSDFIRLESYTLQTNSNDGDTALRVSAVASAKNPFASVRIDVPLELGFGVLLPTNSSTGAAHGGDLVKMADVVTMPFKLRGQEMLRVHVEGIVNSGGESDDAALSIFLRNYLAGRDNNVTIRGLADFPFAASPDVGRDDDAENSERVPPAWLQGLTPRIHATIAFPAPNPPPKLIESVTIDQMKISERGGKMRASGTVVVRARLPPDLARVRVQIDGVRPDVLIFDGEADGQDSVDPAAPPPFPARAFGRIHPDEYLPAISEPGPIDDDILVVRAPIHDVPLDILQGRDKVLSDFVSKIVFKGSAVAGIAGNAAVTLHVVGIDKSLAVDDLPVRGVVNVGRPRPG
ncbi:hypothetical protein NliqN6_1712 [Naganishia liquefaciens]|uniref:Uncharacterized protein n=1 Tax=Naganishia liquefaciens TaxID=104408 RepID=A0A8H3TQF1_9TREE|nr:hypothetical protein NliqN6_1712 [Naganishia liquefaciens]